MAIAGGLDLGFGSQLMIINTKVLCVDNTGSTCTVQHLENLLDMYNRHVTQTALGGSGLTCDFIVAVVAPSDAAVGLSAHVLPGTFAATATSGFPIAGNHANPGTADLETVRQHTVVDIVNCAAAYYDDTAVTSLVSVIGALDATPADAMGDTLVLMEGTAGSTAVIPMIQLGADLLALLIGATVTADADLLGSYVAKGNASGTTPTEFSDITNAAASLGILSYTVIAKAAN